MKLPSCLCHPPSPRRGKHTQTPPSRWHRPRHNPLPSPASGPWRTQGTFDFNEGWGWEEKGTLSLGRWVCPGVGDAHTLSLSYKQAQLRGPTKSHGRGILPSARTSMRQTLAEAMASIDVIQRPGPNGRREASVHPDVRGKSPGTKHMPVHVKPVRRGCRLSPHLCRLRAGEVGLQPREEWKDPASPQLTSKAAGQPR